MAGLTCAATDGSANCTIQRLASMAARSLGANWCWGDTGGPSGFGGAGLASTVPRPRGDSTSSNCTQAGATRRRRQMCREPVIRPPPDPSASRRTEAKFFPGAGGVKATGASMPGARNQARRLGVEK